MPDCDHEHDLLDDAIETATKARKLAFIIVTIFALGGTGMEAVGFVDLTPVGEGDEWVWENADKPQPLVSWVMVDEATLAVYITAGVVIVEAVIWAARRYLAIKSDGEVTVDEVIEAVADGAEVAEGVVDAVESVIEATEGDD